LTRTGHAVTQWSRRVHPSAIVQPSPPAGPFATAFLRLPKSRDEQRMAVHQCLGVLAFDGRLIVYGGNDEGIRSFQKGLAELGPVATLATRGHGRILELRRDAVIAPIKPALADWRQQHASTTGTSPWISYPGLFAGGAPDPGTALLLAHLPPIADHAAILDYGCGPGAISAALQRLHPAAQLTLLDNDSVALEAARENIRQAKFVLGDKLDTPGIATFDLILSNPPLHVGFKEDNTALDRLIADAPKHLKQSGALIMVVQRRIALDHTLAATFATVETLADDGRYRVWRASAPHPVKATKSR
jgi:16S rRNA (guanine1207-N2)-methyltransferase